MFPPNVHIVTHPVVGAQLTKLRQETTSSKEFREGIHNISFALGIEASRSLESKPVQGKSPVGEFVGSEIKPKIGLAPILRAGLGMTEAFLTLFPDAPVYHLGIFREKVTLQPVEYYSKLPPNPPVDQVFLLDPLIATGGTAAAALTMITDWGIPLKNIKLIAILASKQGLAQIHKDHPDLEIWVSAIDEELTQQGIIQPGLGDTGDRLFNTVRA